MARHLGLASINGVERIMFTNVIECPYCLQEGVQTELKVTAGFKWKDEVQCSACQSMVSLEWEKPKWRWYHSLLTAFMILIALLYFAIIAPANAAQLFAVDNYACGTAQDWKGSELDYGEILIKDVEIIHNETDEFSPNVSFIASNKTNSRLPVHIHWIARSETDGNLIVVGAASDDFELKLMKPGDNKFTDTLHLILRGKEYYWCFALGYANKE